jgi:pyrroloquinoline quinone biosynthesis protein B
VRIIVLGSAAGGGFPQWNCNCDGCRRARGGDHAASPRTQASIAVSADGENWFLINASPDLRQQIGATPALQPQQDRRHSPIAGVVLTNGDIDHVAGLLSLRESQPLVLYATERVHGILRGNRIFGVLDAKLVQRRAMEIGQPLDLTTSAGKPAGLRVEAFVVPGKTALYMEDAAAGPGFGTQAGDVVGVMVSSGNARFFYLPGCAAVDGALAARLAGAPLVFFDGTLWRDDEMIQAGVGDKTGQRMGHISVSGEKGSMAAFAALGVRRKVFIHVNNTNPILLDDSPERAAVTRAGWDVAFDGQEIVL